MYIFISKHHGRHQYESNVENLRNEIVSITKINDIRSERLICKSLI